MEEIKNTKSYYVGLAEDNRINLITVEKQSGEQFLFEFPLDFDVSQMIHYKIIDGELVYDEYVMPEPEPEPNTDEVTTDEIASAIMEGVNEV